MTVNYGQNEKLARKGKAVVVYNMVNQSNDLTNLERGGEEKHEYEWWGRERKKRNLLQKSSRVSKTEKSIKVIEACFSS